MSTHGKLKFWRISIILLFATTCSNMNAVSQSIQESVMRQVSPLTPNAASLGKYGDIPVSLYTGIPNINIPLHQIEVAGFTLPISLSYHASGVQVDDISSWVGTGWTLNAGGMINRRMRGVEDYRMINSKNTFVNQTQSTFIDLIQTILDVNSPFSAKKDAANILSLGRYDTESDIFSINAGTLSHKFFLDVDGVAHGQPARKMKITPEGSASFNQGNRVYFARWKVKDEQGVEYIFGRTLDNQKDDYEITRSEIACGASSGDPEFVNSWYLNQIILPTGETIDFSYEYFTFCRKHTLAASYIPGSQGTTISETSTNYMRALRIKEITFPTGRIEFISGDFRRDIPEDRVLDRIVIFSKRSGIDFEEKSFRFITNNLPPTSSSGDNSFRLALRSVTEFDADNTPLSPYKFEYNHSPSEEYTMGLPARGSFQQDLWGYYNHKTDNTQFRFPNYMYLPGDIFEGLVVNGSDRSVDPIYAQRGILKKITYPTQGTTEFTYESNRARGITREETELGLGSYGPTGPWQFKNPVWDLTALQAVPSENHITYANVENTNGNDVGYSDKLIKIIEDGFTDVFITAMISPGVPCTIETNGGAGLTYKCFDISIEKLENGIFVFHQGDIKFDRSYPLSKGTYRLKVQWNSNDQTSNQINNWARVGAEYTQQIVPLDLLPDENTEFIIGGLRIEKIVDIDGITGEKMVRWFDYNYDYRDPVGFPLNGTSGVIQNTPLHYTNGSFLTSFSNSSILQTNGGFVGYKKVGVTFGEDEQGGRQVSYFSTAADYPDGALGIYRQFSEAYETVDVDWRRGLSEGVTDFKFENNGYVPVRVTENDYTFSNQSSNAGNYHQWNVRITAPTNFSIYKTISEPVFLQESTEYIKDSPGEIRSVTSYEQNLANLAVSKTITKNSKGEQVEIVTKYPVDYGNIENLSTLIANNLISSPVKTETIRNNKLVNGIVVKYSDIGQPKEIYAYENEASSAATPHDENQLLPPNYILKNEFKYSAEGNKLVESQSTNNFSTAYVWGYDKSFPVAKIENIIESQIPAQIISSIEAHIFNGGTQVSDFQADVDFLNTQLSTLRNNPKYRVTTYTYNTAYGVTSQTDPNGITTYYETDGFGRLKQIKDDDKNIIKAFEYHYKNQP